MAELSEEDRSELVAYLDGELNEKAAQAFEARLSRDRQLRSEAEALKRTWEMLDFLPRAEPSASFTHRTLERLAVSVSPTGTTAHPRWRIWATVAGWAAAIVIAVGVGLLGARLMWPSPASVASPQVNPPVDVEVLIARDVDVIRNKRLYDNAENLDFARSLPELFGDEEDEL
jgi:anti-sigma factor RsiW